MPLDIGPSPRALETMLLRQILRVPILKMETRRVDPEHTMIA